ncbi:MAG: putative Na+/H+ antiporter [Thermodesulfobacteriota bacterium]
MKPYRSFWTVLFVAVGIATIVFASGGEVGQQSVQFPRSLTTYDDTGIKSITAILSHRIAVEPFNLAATLIFLCAVIHTFLTSKFLAIAHKWNQQHHERIKAGKADRDSVHIGAGIFHFLGEVEAIFGIWAVALGIAITFFYDWPTVIYYLGQKVNYTEPMFVVIIMTLASTRPILKLSELMMWRIANLMGGMLSAWWLTILTIGPVLGSFITEPAAMTISAYLIANKFYDLDPSERFKYATIGLLFVNVSVGGTLSHFAAPPVLMVAAPWGWDFSFMISTIGWKALMGICIANGLTFFIFKRELADLENKYEIVRMKRQIQYQYIKRKLLETELEQTEKILDDEVGFTTAFDDKCKEIKTRLLGNTLNEISEGLLDRSRIEDALEQRFEDIKKQEMKKTLPGLLPENERPPYRDPNWDNREDWVPLWIMIVHVLFMVWTVVNAHHPALFIGGFLFYLGFSQVTISFQNRMDLKPPLLVGFFLAGLVIHGGVQAWWIAPVLGNLSEIPLMLGSTFLTAFNDNAAITFLSTLVPDLTGALKYAVVVGAVTGGGLTVIANAPNPAGQSILKRYFTHGVSPSRLLVSALMPTVIMGLCFMLLRF